MIESGDPAEIEARIAAKTQKQLETAERHAEWLQLRLRGKTYPQIAKQYGVALSTVHEAVQNALKDIKREPAQQLKDMELARLDDMYAVVIGVLESYHVTVSNGRLIMLDGEPLPDHGPVLAAVDRLIKIQERRAKLLGLDAPAKQDVGLTVSYEVPGVDLTELT